MNVHSVDRPLYVTVFINGLFSIAELAFGLLLNNLSLISDAAHNLTDFFALFIALISRIAGRKPPTLKHTYGFRRVEIFSALFNGLLLFSIMALLVKESIDRIIHPMAPSHQIVVIIVGIFAFLANFVSVVILTPHKKEDVNIKIAFLHLLQDSFVSLVVIISALFYKTSFGKYADPIATIIISILVLRSTIAIIWETIRTLLEGVPPNINLIDIYDFVEKKYPNISIHHIHIWQNGPNEILFTAHIQFKENLKVTEVEDIFSNLKHQLEERWNITHITFEPEFEGCGEKGAISIKKSKGTIY
ncbi:MAG: cation diffusion facilitator family transporter [Acidobacteria bacterium]|nr:cation diffusion facilitator family transporter [Acidobacteriota bacterium]